MNKLRYILIGLVAACGLLSAQTMPVKTLRLLGSGGTTTVESGHAATFLSGSSVTFSAGTTVTISGVLNGTPTGGTLNLINVSTTLPSTSVTTGTLVNDAVTFAKMQNIATDRLVGRDTTGSGDAEEISVGGGLEFSGTGGIQRSAITGDVAVAAGSNSATVSNDAVTFAKMQNIATDRLVGRDTTGSGDAEEISVGGGLEFSGTGGIQRSAITGDVAIAAGANSASISNGAVTLAKMGTITTDRLMGRDTAGTGAPEEISVGGGLEWTGSGGIQRSAITGDVAILAGNATATLATVNSVTGVIGNATHTAQLTLNAKGLVTNATAVLIAGGGGTTIGTGILAGNGTGGITNATLSGLTYSGGTLSVIPANTTVSGVVELATNAEAEALSSSSLGLTPAVFGYALNPRLTSRMPADFLWSDGVTVNRRIETIYGAVGAVAGSDWTLVDVVVDVPTANVAATAYFSSFSPLNSAEAGTQNQSLSVMLKADGAFEIRQNAASTSDRRIFAYAGWRAAYSGRRVRVTVAFTGNSTTAPVVYIDGVDISSSFTLTTNGTVPNWVPTSLDTTCFMQGYNWPAGYFRPGRPVNRKFAQADVDFVQLTGRVSAADSVGGSAVDRLTGDNATFASTASWVLNSGATISGGKLNIPSGGNAANPLATHTPGRRYRFTITLDSLTAGNVQYNNGSGGVVFATAPGTYAVDYVAVGATGLLIYAVGGDAVFDTASHLNVGALSEPIIQPILVVADATPNGIGSLVVGFTPVTTRKDWVIQARTNTAGDQQIMGGAVFLAASKDRISHWVTNNTGSLRSGSYGNVAGGAQYRSSGSIPAGLNEITLATRFTGTVNLWVNCNGSDVFLHTIYGHGIN